MRLRLVYTLPLLTTILAPGCRGEDPGGGSATDTSSSGSTAGESSTATPTTSGNSGSSSSSTGTEPTTTLPGFITSNSSGSTGSGGPQPLGGMCMTDDECESMNCYQNPLMPGQGVCSECNEDADCMMAGTGTSCSFGLSGWATCEDGSFGDQCMSQAACMMGLICDAPINIPIPGIVPNTCGECSDSGDCMNGQICSPELDIMMATGAKKCVDPGSVPNDSFCPQDQPDGDMACMSGHCSKATVMGIVTLGICGECIVDGDCPMGQTCMAAMVGMNGIAGSKCG